MPSERFLNSPCHNCGEAVRDCECAEPIKFANRRAYYKKRMEAERAKKRLKSRLNFVGGVVGGGIGFVVGGPLIAAITGNQLADPVELIAFVMIGVAVGVGISRIFFEPLTNAQAFLQVWIRRAETGAPAVEKLQHEARNFPQSTAVLGWLKARPVTVKAALLAALIVLVFTLAQTYDRVNRGVDRSQTRLPRIQSGERAQSSSTRPLDRKLSTQTQKEQNHLNGSPVQHKNATDPHLDDAKPYNAPEITRGAQGKIDDRFKEPTRIDSHDAEEHYNLANVYGRQEKFDDAIAEFKKAIEIDPDHVKAHYYLGLAYEKQGKPDEAVAQYNKAIEINPDYLKAHYYLGLAYRKQGKLDEAVARYKTVIRLDPNYAAAHEGLGIIYAEQGKLDAATVAFQTAVRINPDFAKAHQNLGAAYAEQGKLEKAIDQYKKAIAINPKYAKAHYHLGLVYQKQDKLKEATVHYEKAIRLNPDYTEAHHRLGESYLQQSKHEQAIAYYQQYLRLARANPALRGDILAVEYQIQLIQQDLRYRISPFLAR